MNIVLILHIGSIVTLLLWFVSLVRSDCLEDCVTENVIQRVCHVDSVTAVSTLITQVRSALA